ncbi:MAG TPA: class I SAM-dependent methyltransferase [Pseudonocardiaceae bacterium]|nr:class I SAM-dependent methyltransferase [Pseudonocardiaceae bacterium]
MGTAAEVTGHYSRGGLLRAILDGLAASGADLAELDPDALAPVDEFHIGGRQATVELADQLDLRPGLRVLDVGCGMGGASRYLARRFGVRVAGVDLTPEFVEVARELTARCRLDGLVEIQQASGTDLPFQGGTFDAACLLHVAMNIEDKAALFAEIRRVLVPGGRFGLYEVMRTGDGEVGYPVPWATVAATSFLLDPAGYRQLLGEAGFEVFSDRNRREFALDSFAQLRTRIARDGPPPLGLHIMFGADHAAKTANLFDNLRRGEIAPVEMVCGAR